MKKTILQTHIDLLKECKRQNEMLEKLIELNMNDLHEIADQRDWYYERYRQLKYKYKITKEHLNTPLNSYPPDIRVTNGYTNVVLALWKDSNYCESNTYLPKWQVVNAEYYNANRDKYEGWIDLEDQLPPKEFA